MKKLFAFFSIVCICFQLLAQEEMIKEGWSFGALPAVSFDTDLGFQYGALVNLYDFGDGIRYPKYNHSLYFEVSRFTKGSGHNRFYYDSDRLIKGLQTSVDLSFLTDQSYDFYGFNGYDAIVNSDWIDDTKPDDIYKTRIFYKYGRKMFRLKVDLLGKLAGDNLKWTGGINLLNFDISSVDLDKLNDGKNVDEILPDVPGLYEKYQNWGIISEEEANGGFVPIVKAGVVFDTRDNRPNPMKGIWTEVVLVGAPDFLGAESSFAKLSITHRQYFTLIPDDLAMAYRLVYQTTIGGQVPFYYQSQVITSVMKGTNSEGLGGARSLRGIRRNRVVGDGFILGSVEARWKLSHFRLVNNNFYLGLNGFIDFGKVTKEIENFENLLLESSYANPLVDYYDPGAEQMHFSYGLGVRLAMNQNFILAIDYGVAADKRDGDSGIYIGLNYLF